MRLAHGYDLVHPVRAIYDSDDPDLSSWLPACLAG